MKTCDWPEGCDRPTRANGKCASHYVMWERKHPRPRDELRPRGGKRTKEPRPAEMNRRFKALVRILRKPMARWKVAKEWKRSDSKTNEAIRRLEAAGLPLQKKPNPDNGREVLIFVLPEDADRFLQAAKGNA